MHKYFAILFFVCILFSACERKGCTDNRATNYCTRCDKADNVCKYAGVYHIIWFNKSTSDSLIANGIDTLFVQIATNDPHVPYNRLWFKSTNFFNSPPDCREGNDRIWIDGYPTVQTPVISRICYVDL